MKGETTLISPYPSLRGMMPEANEGHEYKKKYYHYIDVWGNVLSRLSGTPTAGTLINF